MCGIVGSNFCEIFPEVLAHRGPDNIEKRKYKKISLGHTRLAIIDLDKRANQPMEIDDIVIVYNGEIYNFMKIVKEHNLKMTTKSDTEVLIRLYQKYGIDFLNFLNGMFSFCIYDKKRKRFFCARDRFGKKPFYYYFKNGKFIFASEIKAILKSLNYTPYVNWDAFYEYLSFWAPIGENTFYKDIKKLPAGYYLIFNGFELRIEKYYDISAIDNYYCDERNILKNIESLIIDSIKLRLVGDVKIASLLSGGIDSSLVSLLYSKFSEKKIDTFSIGYNEYKSYDELGYAKKVAKIINSNHHEILISRKDFIEVIENFFDIIDEPLGDSASIPTYLLSKEINKSGIKVALSGEGSDEIFLGYDNYFKILDYYNKNPELKEFNLTKEWEYNYRKLKGLPIYQTAGETFTERQKEILLNNYKPKLLIKNYLKDISPVKWFSFIDFKIWIAEVLMSKIDRMSMANSVEIRSPFLDYRLVEYLFRVDDKIKIGNTNKYLLKKIAIKYLPEEIVFRRKKGFSSPFIEWLHDEYGIKSFEIIENVNQDLKIFNMEFVKLLYEESKNKRFKQHYWLIFLFCLWYRKRYK